jgi:hypothetical protein
MLVLVSLVLTIAAATLIARAIRFDTLLDGGLFIFLASWFFLYGYTEFVGYWNYSPGSLLLATIAFFAAAAFTLIWQLRLAGSAAPAGPVHHLGKLDLLWPPLERTPVAVASLVLLAALWLALLLKALVAGPVWETDAFTYHLPAVVSWLSQGNTRIHPQIDFRINYWPHAVHALYGVMTMMTGNERLVGIPNLIIVGVMWPLSAYLALRQLGFAQAISIFCMSLSAVNYVWVRQAAGASSDVAVASLFVLSLYLMLAFAQSISIKRALLLSLALGLMAASKQSGLVFAVLVAIAAAVFAIAKFRRGNASLASVAGAAATVFFIAFCIGGWTYWRNLIDTGNPFFPAPVSLAGLSFEQSATPHIVPWYYQTSFPAAVAWSLWVPLRTVLDQRFGGPYQMAFGPVMLSIVASVGIAVIYACWRHVATGAFRTSPISERIRATFRNEGARRLLVLGLLFFSLVLLRKGYIGPDVARYIFFYTFAPLLLFAWLLQILSVRGQAYVGYAVLAVAIMSAPVILRNTIVSTNFDESRGKLVIADAIKERDRDEELSQRLGADATLVVRDSNLQTPYRYLANPYRATYVALAYGPSFTDPSVDAAPASVYERIWSYLKVLKSSPTQAYDSAKASEAGVPAYRAYDVEKALEVGVPYLRALASRHCVRNVISTVGPIDPRLGWPELQSAGRLGPDYWYRLPQECQESQREASNARVDEDHLHAR